MGSCDVMIAAAMALLVQVCGTAPAACCRPMTAWPPTQVSMLGGAMPDVSRHAWPRVLLATCMAVG